MKILLISYGDIDYDGRLRSLLNVFSQMGEVSYFTRGKAPLTEVSKVSNSSYLKFIKDSVKFAISQGQFNWLVLDNRKATIPGMLILRKCHPDVTIQDCRELYLINEVKYLTGKIGCFFEKKMVRKADIVICANQERAKIMYKEYRLKKEPLTYENLRKLEYESEAELCKAKEELDPLIHEDEIRIISSSGCSTERTNDVLVKNLSNIGKKCRLFLVGGSTAEDEKAVKKILQEKSLDNVEILGRIRQSELKYLISKCHIGIVNYSQYDTNNRLCASGKLYEFLYEGIPVVTTTNPPLKRFCDSFKIGIADDMYATGINSIIENYEEFKNNVKLFIRDHTVSDNDNLLIKQISYITDRCNDVKNQDR